MPIYFGGGVSYKEILCDVCKRLKVNFNEKSEVELIERGMIQKLFEDSIERMSPEEVQQVAKELNITDGSKGAVLLAMRQAMKLGGFKTYQATLFIANAVWKVIFGHGLSLATNATIARVLGVFLGPIGLTLTSIWVAVDIASPAYRVTLPVAIQVAYLRQKYLYSEKEDGENMQQKMQEEIEALKRKIEELESKQSLS